MNYCKYCGAYIEPESNRCGNCQIADLIEPRQKRKEEKRVESKKNLIGFIAVMSIIVPLCLYESMTFSWRALMIMWAICLLICGVCIWLNTRPDKNIIRFEFQKEDRE